ncbi:MAG: phosphate/phosphite/phosphonate ABC transporter substrate-binding protein, partial [Leptospiraceae bacterium]|nr:phosphate/phosphite/phosphonate ABC transporter substrate-binding protein [Leptospiraceae bacterium]
MKPRQQIYGPGRFFTGLLVVGSLMLSACEQHDGSADKPLVFTTIPYTHSETFAADFNEFVDVLAQKSNLHIQPFIAENHVDAVLAFDEEAADIGLLNPLSALVARDYYQVNLALQIVRPGNAQEYRSMFIIRKDAAVRELKDVPADRIGFVSMFSTSGYLLPRLILRQRGIPVGQARFFESHRNVVQAVYDGDIDLGATYYIDPAANGSVADARHEILNQHPDAVERIEILETSDPIPNDPIVFRKDLPMEQRSALRDALMSMGNDPAYRDLLRRMLNVEAFAPADTDAFDAIQQTVRESGL